MTPKNFVYVAVVARDVFLVFQVCLSQQIFQFAETKKACCSGMSSTSGRRFELGSSNQPIQHFVVATCPCVLLLLWFVYETAVRSGKGCNENVVPEDDAVADLEEMCSRLIPLKQFVVICLVAELIWLIMALYVTFYIPRRHRLINEYLQTGVTIFGDVHLHNNRQPYQVQQQQQQNNNAQQDIDDSYTTYSTTTTGDNTAAHISNGMDTITSAILYSKAMNAQPCLSLSKYGQVVYRHPNSDLPVFVSKKVFVYERYTRENIAILHLPNHLTSGQPKVDLEIDRDVARLNQHRHGMLRRFAWVWVSFTLVTPIFIVYVYNRINANASSNDNNSDWSYYYSPDIDTNADTLVVLYCIIAFAIIPLLASLFNVFAWYSYHRSMTYTHSVVEEGSHNIGDTNNTCSNNSRLPITNYMGILNSTGTSADDKSYEPPITSMTAESL